MALGCLDALREAGRRCPQDVSVVGFNDIAWADRFVPPLTTVRLPHYDLGVAAADLLLERLAAAGRPGESRRAADGPRRARLHRAAAGADALDTEGRRALASPPGVANVCRSL